MSKDAPQDLVQIGDGYWLPESFEVAGIINGGISFRLEVLVEGGRAFGMKLTMQPYGESRGLGTTDLREVPLRDILAGGVLFNLSRIEVKGREPKFVEVIERTEDVLDVVRRVVGYNPDPENPVLEFEGVA